MRVIRACRGLSGTTISSISSKSPSDVQSAADGEIGFGALKGLP